MCTPSPGREDQQRCINQLGKIIQHTPTPLPPQRIRSAGGHADVQAVVGDLYRPRQASRRGLSPAREQKRRGPIPAGGDAEALLAPHLPGCAGQSAGRRREAPGAAARPRTTLTWQKHLCAAVSGGCCPPRPEPSSHTAPTRPIRKPQRRPIAALAARRPAPPGPSTRAQAARPLMKPARAGPRRRPTSRPPPRPALGSPASQRPPPPG